MYTATRCIGFLTGVGVMDGGGLGFLLRGFTVAAVGDSSLRYVSFRMTDAPRCPPGHPLRTSLRSFASLSSVFLGFAKGRYAPLWIPACAGMTVGAREWRVWHGNDGCDGVLNHDGRDGE